MTPDASALLVDRSSFTLQRLRKHQDSDNDLKYPKESSQPQSRPVCETLVQIANRCEGETKRRPRLEGGIHRQERENEGKMQMQLRASRSD